MTEIHTMEASLRGSEGRKDDGEVRENQRNGMVVMVIAIVNVLSVPMVQFLSCVLSAVSPDSMCQFHLGHALLSIRALRTGDLCGTGTAGE